MQKILSAKFLFALGSLTLLLFLLPFFFKKAPPLPAVVSSSPANNAQAVDYFDDIEFKLDQAVDISSLSLSSIPEESWSIVEEGNNVYVAKSAQYLKVDTAYVVNLAYQGAPIYALNFKVAPQQSDPRYAQEVVNELERDYPLAAKTPYEEPGFSVVYSAPLTLAITIKNESAARMDIAGTIRDWVEENGLDPDSHSYSFAN
jgi:hypothetical protein